MSGNDHNPPFANSAEKRMPTASERENGMPCGPFSQAFLNGMFNNLQGQFKHLGDQAGVTPNEENDHTYNFRAIEALISAATGGGDTSQFLLMSQARTRLPIFPEIISADGRMNVISPASGTVRVPGGVDFMHRGIFPVTTVETDFNTDASKIYHIRWNPTDGLSLNDLASGTYNPNTLVETDAEFDSDYDDMLVARVITNSSNVPTITNLKNAIKLNERTEFYGSLLNSTDWSDLAGTGSTLNWSRTPDYSDWSIMGFQSYSPIRGHEPSSDGMLGMVEFQSAASTRYAVPDLEYKYDDSKQNNGRVRISRPIFIV